MSVSLDLELDRQVFRPGDLINGTVIVTPGKQMHLKEVIVSLQGEEIADASSLTRTKILPFLNEVAMLPLPSREAESPGKSLLPGGTWQFPLHFTLPEKAPPTYASDTFKCAYYIKGRLDIPWAFDVIEKLHITIVPYEPVPAEPVPSEFTFEQEGFSARIEWEKNTLLAGETLKGSLHLNYSLEETPMAVTLEVRAQEHSLLPGVPLVRTIWNSTRELEIKDVESGYTMVHFEFPIPADAPFSHRWSIFEVAWEFLVTIAQQDKKVRREGRPLVIRRMI
jgi:hypothetical protein